MTTLSSLTQSQIYTLTRLDAGEAGKSGLLAWNVQTADMGVIMSLMSLGLVEAIGFGQTSRRFMLTSEGRRVRLSVGP